MKKKIDMALMCPYELRTESLDPEKCRRLMAEFNKIPNPASVCFLCIASGISEGSGSL